MPADPVVSHADTIRRALTRNLVEQYRVDERTLETIAGSAERVPAHEFDRDALAALAALLAMGERDKAEIERLRKALDRTEDEWERAWERDRRQIAQLTEALREIASWHPVSEYALEGLHPQHRAAVEAARAVLADEEDAPLPPAHDEDVTPRSDFGI